MRLLFKSKDGGPDSNVTGYWLVEHKGLFSIVLLCFSKGSRESYHNHAFNAISWVLYGKLMEKVLNIDKPNFMRASIFPIYTNRERFHKVYGLAENTWVISFRGPWNKVWNEYSNFSGYTTLTNGRKVINENSDHRQSPK